MTEKDENLEEGYEHAYLAKSNLFIGAKYRASVVEHKITHLAMEKIQNGEYEEMPDGIYVSMKAVEIKNKINYSSGTFYEVLKNVANSMTGTNFGVIDDDNKRFVFITLINKAMYQDGIFSIKFASEFKDNLIGFRDDFTRLDDRLSLGHKKPYSYPLYQLLKSICYYPTTYTGVRNNIFIMEISLAELKLNMGVVNSNQSDVRAMLLKGRGTSRDYEKAVEAAKDSKETMFNRWSSFASRCLEPAVKEINQLSDIYVKYEKISGGAGGKAVGVKFIVYLNGAEKTKSKEASQSAEKGEMKLQLSDDDKFTIHMKVHDMYKGYNISYTDIVQICGAANYDMAKIEKASRILAKQTTEIHDVVRWTIKCIEEDYQEPISKPAAQKQTQEGKNKFNNFTPRTYDYEELEKQLLSANRK